MDAVRGNRFLLTAAMTRYPLGPELDRPELAEDVARIAGLFTRDFGYAYVGLLGDSPTYAQLRDGLRDFCRASEREPDDIVAVYLACHGAILDPDDFVLLPSDVDPNDLVPLAIRPEVLIDWLLRNTKVRRLLLMLDTCYSGQGGQDAAGAAVRWVNQPGAVERPGVVLVTATHPWQEAQPGVFSRAFERAVGHLAAGGHAQEYLPIDAVVGVINGDHEKPSSQTVACQELGKTGPPPPFLPNPRYRPRLIDLDLLEQERVRLTEQREAHLRERFVPATKWFTGRHAVLIELAARLNRPAADPRALVVTGNAGSGKTAILGLIAALSDPEQAPAVPRDGLPDPFAIPANSIAEAIYAGTMTTGQVRDRIAAATGLRVETTQELVDGLNRRDGDPLIVLIDALDEATDPGSLASGLIRPLMTECAGTLRLLLGTRSHLLTARLLGTPESNRYLLIDLDSGRYADPASIRSYVRRILLAEDPLDSAYRPSGIYRTAPADVLTAVTEAIGQAAGSSFLVARITATTETTARKLPSPQDPGWRATLPRRAGPAMRRDLRLRLDGEAEKAERLLLPLAYAQGNGLPWENIWPSLVEALSPSSGYSNDDLIWLRRTAGSYVVEGLANGRSVYRLYHQALAEHLLDGRDQHADQRAITNALITVVPLGVGGVLDWAAAHPYIRTHLSTHAVKAGCIDDLLADPAYLLEAARPQLLTSLGAALSPHARSAADAYRRAVPHLRVAPDREHASYLQLAARCGWAPGLADAAEGCRPRGTWSAKWASWHPETPHRTLTGHIGGVWSVASGELAGRPVVISGGGDATVRVWDLASGTPVGDPFTGSTGTVWSVAVGQLDGRPVVVSGGDDRSVRVWDPASGAPVGVPLTGHTGVVLSVTVGELDGRPVLVSGGDDRSVRVWDLASRTHVGDPFTGHTDWVRAVAVAELDGRPVAVSGGDDATVRVWDLASGAPVGDPFTGHIGEVLSVAVGDLDGRPVVVSGGDDATVRVWDLASGAPVGDPFTGHTGRVRAVAVVELDGRPVVVSGGDDATVRVWDLASGAPVGDPFTGHTGEVLSVAVGELDGRPVVVSGGGEFATVRVWDRASPGPVGDPFASYLCAVMVWELPGRPVVSGGDDATVRAPVGDPFTGHTGEVLSVAVGDLDGRPVVISGGDDATVRVWDLASGAPVGDPFTGHTGRVRAVAVGDLDGRPVVVSGDDDATVRVWDLASGSPVGDLFTGQTGQVLSVAVGDLDGRPVVVSGGDDATVRAWDLASRETVGHPHPFTGSTHWVRAVAVGELDGRPVVLSGGDDRSVRVWDLAKRRAVRLLLRPMRLRHPAPIMAMAVTHRQGRVTVVTGCSDNNSRIWDLATRRPLSMIPIPGGSTVIAIALLAPDQIVYANGGTLLLFATMRDAFPVLKIELDSEVRALATYRTSLVAATRLGIVALDIP
jgi:WD40 repeat protein